MKSGSYRTSDGKAQIDWELKDTDRGAEFSASGEYDGGGGQNIDTIADAYPDDATVQRIAAVWKTWHLNGMKAGLPVQQKALATWEAAGNKYEYDAACKHLESLGLLVVPIPEGAQATGGFPEGATTYTYGRRWVYMPIPPEVLAEIESWPTGPEKPLHDAQADEFLARHGLKLRITLSDTKPARWEPAGHHYRVTLSGKGRRMTFDFWGSAADAEANRAPAPHSVLSCLASDAFTPDTFEEFCSELGYDEDSRTHLQTFRRADRFAHRIREFFSEEEMDDLQQIR